ncbi:hypothetical protein Catovirus_1_960 [Catovirus CTV1]|uniref:Uncharacterized protein n=1 Tax=Catovirus CTV1 TaxID=1977631 RepID=A0A1V0SB14_9VIRU|nr:hypothetical protein Catovirus_1_960 [Catovirus CTV1]
MYNNFGLIKLENIFKMSDNTLKKIVDKIYLSDKSQIFDYLKKANSIINNNKYKNIPELYASAYNLVQFTKNILNDCQIDVTLFNSILEDFELIYNKFLDDNYKTVTENNRMLSKIIQMTIVHNNRDNINELKKKLEHTYSLNNFSTIQFIINKSKFLLDCGNEIYDMGWSLIEKSYNCNSLYTIYVLLLELRKVIIDLIDNPTTKKYIYYNIDIETIKLEIQCKTNNCSHLFNSVKILRKLFNLTNNDTDFKIIFQDFKKMFYLINSNKFDFNIK